MHAGPPYWQSPTWPLASGTVRSAGLPVRHIESTTTEPTLTPKCIPWLHDTLLHRMQAMFLTSCPFTLGGHEHPGRSLARGRARLPVAPLEVDELDRVAALDLGAVLVGVVGRAGAAVLADPARPAVRVARELDVPGREPNLDRVGAAPDRAAVPLDPEHEVDRLVVAVAAQPSSSSITAGSSST